MVEKNFFFFLLCFLLLSFTSGSEILLEFTRQSGGHTGETTMITTDNTVWQSSIPVYNNGSLYYMEYMFDRQHPAAGWSTGWMGGRQIGAGNFPDYTEYLTVTFAQTKYITRINLFNIMHSSYYSSASVSVSYDGINYVHKGNAEVGNHYLDANYYNYSVNIPVNAVVKSIRYDFYDVHYGPVITEMEIYSDSAGTVPESTSLLCLVAGLIFLYKQLK